MAQAPTSKTEQRPTYLPKGRLEAFADGVFAIVITLLVLELEVPGREAQDDLLHALGDEWRSYLAYLISFAFVGGIWMAHANATRLIARCDDMLFRLNLLVLFFVTPLPFTTSVMATFLDGDAERVAVVLYGVNLLVASLVLNAFVLYAAHKPGLVADEVADEELQAAVRARRGIVITQAVATAVALVLPSVAVAAYLIISIGFIVLPLVWARRGRRATTA